MLDTTHVWDIASRMPRLGSGALLHRWALMAAHRGAFEVADRLFDRAADRYRAEIQVERLARLRVHQLMIRVRALETPEREPAKCLEVEHLLTRLDRIESLEPPFDLVDATTLLATWIHSSASSSRAEVDAPPRANAA